jgi:hypothetical protein
MEHVDDGQAAGPFVMRGWEWLRASAAQASASISATTALVPGGQTREQDLRCASQLCSGESAIEGAAAWSGTGW